jgi:hypothetical protein
MGPTPRFGCDPSFGAVCRWGGADDADGTRMRNLLTRIDSPHAVEACPPIRFRVVGAAVQKSLVVYCDDDNGPSNAITEGHSQSFAFSVPKQRDYLRLRHLVPRHQSILPQEPVRHRDVGAHAASAGGGGGATRGFPRALSYTWRYVVLLA